MKREPNTRYDNAVLGSSVKLGLVRYAGVIIFLFFWFALSWSGLINSLLLPSPVRVLEAIWDVGPALIRHLLATVLRIFVGYSLGVSIGLSIGLAMQYHRYVFAALDGLIETFRPVPPVAVIPFFILLFGFSEIGKILIAVLGVCVLIIVTAVEAAERVSPGLIRWGLVLGLSRWSLFRLIILPAAWPEMRGGFRIALALTVTLVIVSEFMGATYGLGYLLSVSKVTLTTPTILLTIIILGWLGWGLDRSLRLLFDRTTRWDIRAKGATR